MSSEPLFICVFNYGAIHLGLNHLQSLRRCGITNYKAFVTDTASVNALTERGHPVEYVTPEGNYGMDKMDFDSPTFNSMSYLRYKVIIKLLEQGQIVWYMDVDTVVVQNVLPVYECIKVEGIDICFQNDVNMPCTGCMLCWPNPATIDFFRKIYTGARSDICDQVLVSEYLRQAPDGIKIGLFDKTEFPNGLLYFCDDLENQEMVKQYSSVVIPYKEAPKNIYFVHANWMVGNDVKIAALQKHGLWFIPNMNMNAKRVWSMPGYNRK